MKLGKTYFSGSLTFDEGTNTLGPNSSNITGSFSGSLKGTITATGNIIPAVSGAYDLGSTAFPFKDLYITQNSLKFIDDTTGSEIGRISVNSNTGDIKLLNTKNLTEEQKASLTAENVGPEALSPVSASAIWVSQSISPGHTNTTLGHTNQKFHTVHTQFVSASSTAISGDLTVGGKVTAQEFHTEFVSASIIYESGSTQFGNSADDTHVFTGNISIGTSGQYGKFSLLGTDNTELTTSRIGISSTSGVVASIYNTDQTANSFAGLQLITRNSSASHWGIFNKSVGVSDGTLVIGHGSGGTGFERIVVTSDGKVGIGTSSPNTNLHIIGNIRSSASFLAGSDIGLEKDGETFIYNNIRGTDSAALGGASYVALKTYTSGWQDRLRIIQNGNVGIGTTSPSAKLHINHNNTTLALTYGNSVANNPLHTAFYGGWSGIGMDQTTAGIRLAGDISSGNPIVDMGYYTNGTVSHANWNSQMIVRQNGYVGIGTANPGYPLHVRNSGIYHITAEQTSTDTNNNAAYATFYVVNNAGSSQLRGYFGAGGNNVGNTAMRNHIYFGAQSNHGVRFFTNDTAKMTITSGGLVGINTTAPTYVLQSESGGVASYFKGGDGGYAAVAFSGDNNSTIGVLTTYNSGIYFGRSNGSFGSAFGANSDIFIKGSDGNVGINTTSPTAKLDINGTVRYRGDIYYDHEFVASGNYTANTWYEVVNASQIPSGIYIIKCYVDLYGAGYGIYFCWYASIPFEFNNIGTNRVTTQDLPTVYGTGHAHATPPSFRITQELAGISRIQFSHVANWTGIDNTSGKAFRVYMKRIGG